MSKSASSSRSFSGAPIFRRSAVASTCLLIMVGFVDCAHAASGSTTSKPKLKAQASTAAKTSEVSVSASSSASSSGGRPNSQSKAETSAEEARVQAAVAKEKAVLNQYSLEELNSAATYLMAVFEKSLDTKKPQTKILECDPSPETAQLWLSGPLHALIDEKTELESKVISKSIETQLKKVDKKWHACADQCQCTSYVAVIEQIESRANEAAQDEDTSSTKAKVRKLSTPDQNRLHAATEYLNKVNKKVSAQVTLQCASQQNWFCHSPLEKYLSEAAEE